MFVNETFFNAIYDRELAPWICCEFCDFSKSMLWFFHFCTMIFVQPYWWGIVWSTG